MKRRVEHILSDSLEIEEYDPSHSLIGLKLNRRLYAFAIILILPNRPITPIIVRKPFI